VPIVELDENLNPVDERKTPGWRGVPEVQGARQGALDIAGMLDLAIKHAPDPSRSAGNPLAQIAGLVRRATTPGLSNVVAGNADVGPATRAATAVLPARVEPTGAGAGLREAAARGVVGSLPTIGMGGGALLPRIAANLASGATGSMASRAAEDAGYGRLGQFAAGMAGGSLPGLGMAAGRGMAGAAGNIGRRATGAPNVGAARQIADEVLGSPVMDRGEAVRRLAYEVDPATAGARFGTTATTAQALEEIAPGMGTLEKSYSRAGGATSAIRFEQRRQNMEAMRKSFQEMYPQGVPDQVRVTYREQAESLARQVDEAYGAVGDIAGISTGRLRETAMKLQQDAGVALAETLPDDVMRVLGKYGDEVDLGELNRLRRLIVRNQRVVGRQSGDPEQLRYLTILKQSVDDTLDDVAKSGGRDAETVRALDKAIDLRAQQGRLFGDTVVERTASGRAVNRPNQVTKAFERYEDSSRAVVSLMNGPAPARSIQRLHEALGSPALDSEEWRGVQTIVRREMMGDIETLFEQPHTNAVGDANKFLARIKRPDQRAIWEVAHGPGSAARGEAFINRFRKIRSGVTGTTAESAVTGSNVPDPDSILTRTGANLQAMGALRTGGLLSWSREMIRVARSDASSEPTRKEAERLIHEALNDPSVGRWAYERMPKRMVPWWSDKVKSILTNQATRTERAAQFSQERDR
jgi:hypothetical protein